MDVLKGKGEGREVFQVQQVARVGLCDRTEDEAAERGQGSPAGPSPCPSTREAAFVWVLPLPARAENTISPGTDSPVVCSWTVVSWVLLRPVM